MIKVKKEINLICQNIILITQTCFKSKLQFWIDGLAIQNICPFPSSHIRQLRATCYSHSMVSSTFFQCTLTKTHLHMNASCVHAGRFAEEAEARGSQIRGQPMFNIFGGIAQGQSI